VRSPASPRRPGRLAAGLVLVLATGCGASDDGLAWSVRRGQVGEFAVAGTHVVTIGREVAVHDVADGRRLRRAALPADLGDITIGQLGPGAMLTGDVLVFGWYDFRTDTGTVFCYDAASLTRRWHWEIRWPWTERSLRPTVAVVADARQVYAAAIGKNADNLFAFRLADGRLAWSRSVETFPAEAALALDGDRLLVRSQLWARPGDRHEQLDAIAIQDGRRLWRSARRAGCGNCDEGPQPERLQPDGTYGPIGPEGDDIWAVDRRGQIVPGCSGAVAADGTVLERLAP